MENQTPEINNMNTDASVPVAPEVQPVVLTNDQQPKTSSFLTVLLSVLLLASVAIAGFFAFQTQKLVNELQVMREVPKQTAQKITEPTVEPVATTDPTADWKVYTNNVLKYTIRYPSDWILDKSKAELPISEQNSQELSIYKDQYKLTILWPSAYGPSMCLFDDESRVGAPEFASYCEGKYIVIKSNLNTQIHRRLDQPENLGTFNQWGIYTQENGGTRFVTVPPISFRSPLNYNIAIIQLMDQILTTYTSTN